MAEPDVPRPVGERERMLSGASYDPRDPELARLRARARRLCAALDAAADADDDDARSRVMRELFGSVGQGATVQPPFRCDYGSHIHLGDGVFVNFNCVMLDVREIRIGAHALLGPGVQILPPLHPLDAAERRTYEYGRPVYIGADAWLGGGVQVLAGVRIGDRAVIGAGSVVTRDIPDGVLAVGNPCRVLRALD